MIEETTISDVDLLRVILKDAGDRIAINEISQTAIWRVAHPGNYLSDTERRTRLAAQKSRGEVLSYQGSPGYKLRALASAEEVITAIAKVRHQANEMQIMAMEIETWGQTEANQGVLL